MKLSVLRRWWLTTSLFPFPSVFSCSSAMPAFKSTSSMAPMRPLSLMKCSSWFLVERT